MSSLTIHHVTTYRYQRPVGFGEHRMMLRPRDTGDQKVLGATLEITPKPVSLDFVQDSFGNHVGIALFGSRSSELRFESVVSVDQVPADPVGFYRAHFAMTFPTLYSEEELIELSPYIARQLPDPGDNVGDWTRKFLPVSGTIGIFELLSRLSQGINQDFSYRRREAKGIQKPDETLQLGHGSCRDFALLLIEAARAIGLAARFASGYLAVPLDAPDEAQSNSARGSTHAWAQVYLPGAGWVDFDPTSGSIGKQGLVTVAVAHDPIHTLPLYGTFIGHQSDSLGMEVEVTVTSGMPQPDAVG